MCKELLHMEMNSNAIKISIKTNLIDIHENENEYNSMHVENWNDTCCNPADDGQQCTFQLL